MAPLYTTPALEFLDSIINDDWKVFEYGGGHSTRYYLDRCAEVHTVDHDDGWYSTIRRDSPDANVELVTGFEPTIESAIDIERGFYSKGFDLPIKDDRDHGYNCYHGLINDDFKGYASTICRKPHGYFDLVVVDGMARSLCLWYAMHMVKDRGIIILDNSDRWQLNDLQCHLISSGLNRIDFWQPEHPCWCTSFFSKRFDVQPESCNRPKDTGDLYHFN